MPAAAQTSSPAPGDDLLRVKARRAPGLCRRHLRRRGADEVQRARRVPAGQELGLRRQGRVGGRRLQRGVPAGAGRPPEPSPRRPQHRRPPRRLRPPPAPPATSPSSNGESSGPATASSSGRSSAGELAISGYALMRYLNQSPGEPTFTDHLGNERTVDGRNDIYPHRVMIFFKGWLGTPEADLRDHALDRELHRPARHLRQPRLPVQPEVQPVRRPQREPRHALAPGLAPVLARPRPRDGRRVLPAVLRLRRLGAGRSRRPASGTTS